jgi:hypothetical protein
MKLEESKTGIQGNPSEGSERGFQGEQSSTTEDMRRKAGETASQLRQAGEEKAREAAEQGGAFLADQKEHVAEVMHHCGDAFQSAAEELRQKHDPNLASAAQALAERLERGSSYLRTRQLQGIREDVENFARNQPQLFYGGLLVAGLVLSRFFKASQSQPKRDRVSAPERETMAPDYAGETGFTRPEPAPAIIRPASKDVPVI